MGGGVVRTKRIKRRRSQRGTGIRSMITLHHSKKWNEVLHTELSSSLNIGTAVKNGSPTLLMMQSLNPYN
jgi:hypothetical protein